MVNTAQMASQLGSYLIQDKRLEDGVVINIRRELKSIGYPVKKKSELRTISKDLNNYLHKVSYCCKLKNKMFIEISSLKMYYGHDTTFLDSLIPNIDWDNINE